MTVLRVKTRWTIPGAGTAFSVMHFDDGDIGGDVNVEANQVTLATHNFWDSVRNTMPSVVKVQVMPDVEIIDVETGDLIGVSTATTRAELAGANVASAGWSAPAGACITWTTSGIRTVTSKPRRVRGRTFIVPLSGMSYDTNGNLTDTALATINNAAATLRSASSGQELAVYARPNEVPAVPGQAFAVTGHRLTDQVAILRSRRS
jgi:hypothetical protein